MNLKELIFAFVCLVNLGSAIHFYAETGQTKCFYEELPKGTVVIAKLESEVGSTEAQGGYEYSPMIKLDITVDVSISYLFC